MRPEVSDLLNKMKKAGARPAESGPLSEAGNCLETKIRAIEPKAIVLRRCPDHACRSAFWVEIDTGTPHRLVVEASNLGPYARLYWKREGLVSSEYLDDSPAAERSTSVRWLPLIKKSISECGLTLLASEELNERVLFQRDEFNPDDEATLGSVIFASEYH